ncbi:unnamed protein product [Adineta ricciae]|uniref:Uncharacterized protein n=2 Tax=Adineta ricciae TaxID=249248 RepID=A0A815MZU1_ADIRI|nr:unnamed protein product [Adineta ricciae]
MSETNYHCTDQEIKQIVYFLRLFRPNELGFLLNIGSKWSRYDPNRLERITFLFNSTFKTNQPVNIVQHTLTFFDRNRSLSFNHNFPLNEIAVQQLDPFRSDCPVCGNNLHLIAASVQLVKMYCLKGRMIETRVFSVTCSHNQTSHTKEPPISIYPNFIRQGSLDTWTSDSLNSGDFVYLGGRHAFERALIEGYTCQLLGSPSSWNKAVDGWNLEAFNSGSAEKRNSWQLRLSLAFMKYKTIQFDLCVGNTVVNVPSSIGAFDQWAWDTIPDRLVSFVYLWSNHASLMGACGIDCCRCIVMDGHQKCRRRVCRAKQVMVSTEEFDSLKIGCCRTPIRGSQYCELHQDQHLVDDLSSSSIGQNKQHSSLSTYRQKWRRRSHIGLDATSCRTRKSKPDAYVNRCSRSFGLIAGVTNCKIIVTFSELFRCETLREILSLLFSTIRASDGCFPPTVVYDDGCHLAEYLQNHFDVDLAVTPASMVLKRTPFSIDRVHFKNHVGRWCRKNMNPDNNRLLDGVNTEAAEQLFSWLKGYANILSCLGWRRSASFMLILFHNKNLERKNVRPTRTFEIISKIPQVKNICLAHVADSTTLSDMKIKNRTDHLDLVHQMPAQHLNPAMALAPTTSKSSDNVLSNDTTVCHKPDELSSKRDPPLLPPETTPSLFHNPWTVIANTIREDAQKIQRIKLSNYRRNAKRWRK